MEPKIISKSKFNTIDELPKNYTGRCYIRDQQKTFCFFRGVIQDILVFKTLKSLPVNFTGQCYIKELSAHCWFVNGKYHNANGPAFVFDKEDIVIFYINGLIHNSNEAAFIWKDGTESFWNNGVRNS